VCGLFCLHAHEPGGLIVSACGRLSRTVHCHLPAEHSRPQPANLQALAWSLWESACSIGLLGDLP
jgi:hypothetical protein